jgi:hypothetical protein
MFKKTLYISIVVALLSVTASADNRQNGKQNSSKQHKKGQQNPQNRGSSNTSVVSELTAEQKEGLIFMIEEEKVARDVYTTLYNTWGTRVFTNIAKSEQKHMNAVQNILDKYNLEAPLTLDTVGSFQDEHLQTMYNDLIAKGNSSLIDALEVGIMIEEVDIADLEELIEAGVPSDIERVYNNLLNGSYKHLSAFNRELARQ